MTPRASLPKTQKVPFYGAFFLFVFGDLKQTHAFAWALICIVSPSIESAI